MSPVFLVLLTPDFFSEEDKDFMLYVIFILPVFSFLLRHNFVILVTGPVISIECFVIVKSGSKATMKFPLAFNAELSITLPIQAVLLVAERWQVAKT